MYCCMRWPQARCCCCGMADQKASSSASDPNRTSSCRQLGRGDRGRKGVSLTGGSGAFWRPANSDGRGDRNKQGCAASGHPALQPQHAARTSSVLSGAPMDPVVRLQLSGVSPAALPTLATHSCSSAVASALLPNLRQGER